KRNEGEPVHHPAPHATRSLTGRRRRSLEGGLTMHRAIRSLVLSLLVAAMTLFLGPREAMAVTWTVDNPNDGVQCLGANFTTISAAVAVANANPLLPPDIIVVCDGDYFEQVVIDRSLTLQAAQGQTPTIHFPSVATDPNKAVVRVTGVGGLE